ncbi:VOC family protein [Leptospira semungkisensis]|nr:VOC family protein [Leptospira semungkisensis]
MPTRIPRQSEDPISKAQDIAYVRLGRKDLESAYNYYSDFGLRVKNRTEDRILFHAISSEFPCWSIERANRDFLLGFGFFISDKKQFEELQKVKGAILHPKGRFGDIPSLTILDPSGLPVDAVYSSPSHIGSGIRSKRSWNRFDTTKRINTPQPSISGPPEVIRLGHAVFLKQEFYKNAQWYCDTFGLIPSDIQILPGSKEPVLSFLRCDRGGEVTDHHTIVIASGADDRLEHCAFELNDLDEIAQGREWLLNKGWKPAWGLGRHLLGSQIFDYERDPTGMLVEHYTDGDKFDRSVPVGFHEISRKSLYQWVQDMPEDFLDTKLNFRTLKELIKGIISGRKIQIKTLIQMKTMASRSPRKWINY